MGAGGAGMIIRPSLIVIPNIYMYTVYITGFTPGGFYVATVTDDDKYYIRGGLDDC